MSAGRNSLLRYWSKPERANASPSLGEAFAPTCFGRDERGSVAIEFAFIAVVFLTILFGIMSYGFQFATRIALSYAVSEGGRAAVMALDTGNRRNYAEAAMDRALESYAPLVLPDNAVYELVESPVTLAGVAATQLAITLNYTDNRFSFLPFIPTPDEVMRVSTTYIVTDPDG